MLKQLKSDTAALHDRVEEAMNSNALMGEAYSRDQYSHLLNQLFEAHSTLEPVVYNELSQSGKKIGLDLKYRLNKRALLWNDLRHLGAHPQSSEKQLHLKSYSEAWGAFYVLEGSSLGGAVIHKSLQKRRWPESILSFYGFYGAKTGVLWKEFREVFKDEEEKNQLDYQEVLEGASKAYEVFLSTARN